MDDLRFFWYFDVLRQGVVVEGHIQACSIETKTVVTKARSHEETVYKLIYSFDYNETNYVQSNEVSLPEFKRFQEGDRVKVRVSARDPTLSRLEEA